MSVAAAPFREAEFMAVDLDVERRDNGSVVLRSRVLLGDYEPNLARALASSVARQPDKCALAFRGADGAWQHISYADFGRQVDTASLWLLGHVPRGRAVIVMAGNTLPAAVLTFACYAAGVIHCPVGLAYGMAGGDHARLRHVIAKTDPALIYFDAHPVLAAAVGEVAGDVPAVCMDPSLIAGSTPWADVVAAAPAAAATVAAVIAAVDTQAIASYMLTSGSTGLPKVVPVSQDNIAACTKQGLLAIGKAAGWGGTMLDWLPWHHAAGASVLRATLLEGGTLHVDAGKPAPGLFDQTITNLREIPVAYFNNVPLGYAMLVDAMETDAVLRRQFFSKLRLMLYGGAGLPQHVLDRLQQMAVAETGHRIHMTTGYGMTETVTGCMVIHFPTDKVGIGLPTAGLEVKLVPHDARYEVRLRGPNVMRGYLDDAEKNREVFDDEGFYRTGDLALFHDIDNPEQGLVFAGRLAEEFKLSNGNWVYGGQLREELLKALAGVASEVVLCDDGRDYLAVLVWPVANATLDAVTDRLSAFNAAQRGSGALVRRIRLLTSPPSADANEISDKGTINRRAVLDARNADVAALYADPPGDGVGIVA
jgi:feruloyl-CoA synthase